MNPSRHHRLRQQVRLFGFLFGAAYLLAYLVSEATGVPSIVSFLLLHSTGIIVSPRQVDLVNTGVLSLVLLTCWVVPSVLFRWFILPRCPHCAARTRLVTESGVQYVCRTCSYCHDTGTMKILAEAEGAALER